MEVLFFLASGLLIVTGASKLRRPQPASDVLAAIGGTGPSKSLARAVGGLEFAVGIVGLARPSGVGGTAVASLYLVFAAFLLFLIRFRPSVGSCGCTGRRDTPPNVLHAGLDVVAAGVAFAVAVSPSRGLVTFIGEEGVAGVVGLAVAAFLGYALTAMVAYLPRALRAPQRVPVAKRHGGVERAQLVDELFHEAGIGPDDPSLWGANWNGARTA